jgi:putative tricarboxylic transport membrane protein
MRRGEIACAVVLLILAGVVAQEAIRLDMCWGDIGPKAGFFPFWLSVILGFSSLSVITRAILGWQKRTKDSFLTREQLLLLLTVLVPIALVVPLIEIAGFYLTSFLYLSLYIWWAGRNSWLAIASISSLFPIVIYLIFERWFLIPLPKGYLGPYLPF